MSGYRFSASCGRCGGPLEHMNGVARAGTESLAIAKCAECGADWSISTYLRPIRHVGNEKALASIQARELTQLRALEGEQRQMRRERR